MSFVSINGAILRINPEGEMLDDVLCRDRVIFDISEPRNCDEFREKVKAVTPEDVDKKQAVVDAVMAQLEAMHQAVERSLRA
jgi:glycerol-3-phosphate O-acyltransferase